MIFLVCPACKKSSNKAQTKLTIVATGLICIVPSRERGVERAVASPIQMTPRCVSVNILPGDILTCQKCGEESSVKLWKYMVVCDHCGKEITLRSVKDPSTASDRHICRDTMSLYCDKCWSHSSNQEYCPGCRYRENCYIYNNR